MLRLFVESARGKRHRQSVAVFQYLRGIVESIVDQKDIDEASIRAGDLLDESLVVDALLGVQGTKGEFRITQSKKILDLSTLSFEKLREEFKNAPYKTIEISDSQTKQRVRSTLEDVLNTHLPDSYDRVLFKQKCDNVYELMMTQASQGLRWAA